MDPTQNSRRQIKKDSGRTRGRKEKREKEWKRVSVPRRVCGREPRRTHIKYQPEDYHRPAPPLAGFPASAFCRGSFYREYMHQPALCYFPPFFPPGPPFSSVHPLGCATDQRPFSHLPLNPPLVPLLPADSTYSCTVLLPVTSRGACNLRTTARNYQ